MARQVFAKAFKLEAARLLDAGKQPTVPFARELRLEREKFYAWLARLSRCRRQCRSEAA